MKPLIEPSAPIPDEPATNNLTIANYIGTDKCSGCGKTDEVLNVTEELMYCQECVIKAFAEHWGISDYDDDYHGILEDWQMKPLIETTLHYVVVVALVVAGLVWVRAELPNVTQLLVDRLVNAAKAR